MVELERVWPVWMIHERERTVGADGIADESIHRSIEARRLVATGTDEVKRPGPNRVAEQSGSSGRRTSACSIAAIATGP